MNIKFRIFLLVFLLLILLTACDLNPGDFNDDLVVVDEDEIPSLYEEYNSYFPIGAAVAVEWNRTLDSHVNLIKKHFNSLTAENEMKPSFMQPVEGQFNFGAADELLEFAKNNNKIVRGHTLVWHSQTPDWFFEDNEGNRINEEEYISQENRQLVINRMEKHIKRVVSEYKGRVYAWDVVNEVISDNNYENYRTDSPWFQILGEDFVKMAFEFTHDTDPNAKLFYNDYNATNPIKRDKIYNMIKDLIENGVPVHGIGLQAHWNIYGPSIEEIEEAIIKYASINDLTDYDFEIQITELDLSMFEYGDNSRLEQPTDDMLKAQAVRYREIFELFREYSDVITGVTLWGVADDATWLDNFPVENRDNWPLLFDENHWPKEAFWEVVESDIF